MSKEGIVNCYCGDNSDDGRAVLCEHCHTWQHERCVNLTKFAEPEHYVCPRCRDMDIGCSCGKTNNFKKALIYCTKCHKYFHKRHVGVGFGENPSGFICPACSSGQYRFTEKEVCPIPSFLPRFNVEIPIHPIKNITLPLPPGPLRKKLESVTSNTSAAALVSFVYSNFKSVLFQGHPMVLRYKQSNGKNLAHFQFAERINDSWDFAVAMIRALAFMTSLPRANIVQILDHLITLDIYKKPMPALFRESPDLFLMEPDEDINDCYDFSERGEDCFVDEKPKFKCEKLKAAKTAKLKIVPGPLGMMTVVADEEIKVGEMICYAYGNIMKLEEMDKDCVPPEFEMIKITSTNLVLDSSQLEKPAIFQHIRRGFVSNCELRIFDIGDDRFLGIFATPPTPLPLIGQKKSLDQTINIREGDELVLPFDIPPTCVNTDTQWCTIKPEKYIIKVNEIMPQRPEQSTIESIQKSSETNEAELEAAKKAANKQQPMSLLKNLFSDETKVFVELKGTTKYDSHEETGLPLHVAHFAPPGKKAWRGAEREVEQISIPSQWYKMPFDKKEERPTQSNEQKQRGPPRLVTLWNVPSDDSDVGMIDVTEEYLMKALEPQ